MRRWGVALAAQVRQGGRRVRGSFWPIVTAALAAAAAYLVAVVLVFLMPSPAWVVGLAGLGYVANTLRFWNITDETSDTVNRAWKVFLWLNYLVGAIITVALVSAFTNGV